MITVHCDCDWAREFDVRHLSPSPGMFSPMHIDLYRWLKNVGGYTVGSWQ